MHKKSWMMNIFYVPALILFCLLVIYPLIKGVGLSFTNWNGYSQKYRFTGLDNYARFFGDKNIWIALGNTLKYGIGSTLLQNIIGLALALFLNDAFRGRSVVRTIVYLPVMVAPLIMGYIMYFFFTYDNGALNDVLALFGKAPVDFLANGRRSVYIITAVNSLQFVGISMVIYLAGLQNIPDMYYEAASLDGASNWWKLKAITIPMLFPAINSSIVINLIGGLKLFDIIQALTAGGPGYSSHSLSTLVHRTYFRSEAAGYASAIGLMSFVLIMVISNIVVHFLDKKEIDV